VALCASAAAFFFYRRWKSAQAASQDLYRIHTPQHPPENAYVGTSSSVETRSDASLVRQHTFSPSTSQSTSWQSYQQADYDSQRLSRTTGGVHAPSSGMPTVDEVVENLATQSPVDEVGTRFFRRTTLLNSSSRQELHAALYLTPQALGRIYSSCQCPMIQWASRRSLQCSVVHQCKVLQQPLEIPYPLLITCKLPGDPGPLGVFQ
jgi:hypothetical protein